MPLTYTRAQLKSDVNGKIKGKSGILVDFNSTINQGIREVFSHIDIATSIRRTYLVPNLFDHEFQYFCPADLKGDGIINIKPQTYRAQLEYTLTTAEEFWIRRDPNTIAVDNHDATKTLLINSNQAPCKTITVAPLDTVTSGGGTWQALGGATNVRADSDNFVNGNGSLEFDISANMATTAGVQNTTLNVFDASAFFGGNGALFVWAWITSTVNLTNYILKIGSSTSNYYQKTVTAQNDGTAFVVGWNLLRFDLVSLTTVGTPVTTSFNYIALYMTKGLAKVSETNYRFDSIKIKKGEPNILTYYSKYPWQTQAGVYIENSKDDTDLLNVDMDEYNLCLLKCTEYAAEEVDEEIESVRVYRGQVFLNPRFEKFTKLQKSYESKHPSQAMSIINIVADFIHLRR